VHATGCGPFGWQHCAGIVKAIGKALGKEPKIVHFNPKDFDKKAFPFRCCRAGRAAAPTL
jgi:hypothetical protein